MAEGRAFDWRVYRAVAIGFLALKLALLVLARPFMDETYYWLWGQHAALSYFDHPPMVGWTASVASLLGWNVAGLRVMVLATLIGDLLLLRAFARHLNGAAWRDAFWPSAALLATTPIFFGLTQLALPDHLLIVFSLLALYAFTRFRTAFEAGERRWRFLYLAAFAIGLATLGKYTGTLLAVGIFVLIVSVPRLRPLFRTPHLYLAAVLALAMQAPVLLWNLQHGFASFDFVMAGRAPLRDLASLSGLVGYLLGIALVLSPFLLWPLGRFLAAGRDGHGLARILFWLSTLVFLAASVFTNILIHWNIIAYVAVLPFLHAWLRSRILVVGHFLFGGLIALVLAVNTTLLPVQSLISFADQTSAWSYGWDEVAAETKAVAAEQGADFIAATDYALASPLAFALADRNVVSLSPRREAFDFWFDPEAHRGQTAIIVADRWRPLPETLAAQFAEVTEIRTVNVERFGRPIDSYVIYVARGYSPLGQ